MSKNQEDFNMDDDDTIILNNKRSKTRSTVNFEGMEGSSTFARSSNKKNKCLDVEKAIKNYAAFKIAQKTKKERDENLNRDSSRNGTTKISASENIHSIDQLHKSSRTTEFTLSEKEIPSQKVSSIATATSTCTGTATATPDVSASQKNCTQINDADVCLIDRGQNLYNFFSSSTFAPSNEEIDSRENSHIALEVDYTIDPEEYSSFGAFGRMSPMKSSVSRGLMNSNREDIRKFHVLDETDESESAKSASEDSDVPDEEVERMLEDAYSKKRKAAEAGLDSQDHQQSKGAENGEAPPFEEKDKVVLVEKGRNHFDVLPEGWMQVTHNSGMPIYLQKTTRVCTLSRPYFLGPGSARKHEIPLSAIPCLSYRRHLEEEEHELAEAASKNTSEGGSSAPLTPLGGEFPSAKIQTVEESLEAQNLTPEQLRDYCKGLFEFKTIRIVRFKSWVDRRQYTKRKKQERQLQRPMLPDGTKLITFPIQSNDPSRTNSSNTKKEWIMNPNGKSYVCILHEYVQHALKKQPAYKFTELENAATPYAATVSIDDMQYGVGYGTSKKQAKSEAAKNTLEILIPEMKQKITRDEKTGNSTKKDNDYDTAFFDEIRVEDPRVADFCAKTTEPSPHDILLTCLQRNFGLDSLQISYQGSTVKHQMNEFTMTVGKHTATVLCRNKRDGKQRAAQKILQALHPHITSWGSLLRLYGNRSVKCFKEKKLEEQEITLLQSKAAVNSPNFAILDKLKLELSKLGDKRGALKPIGVFISPGGDNLPKLSSSNLKNVDL